MLFNNATLCTAYIINIFKLKVKKPNKISNKEIDKYTYKKDKKSLSKRISEHLNSAEREQTSKDTLKFYITRLLDNEVLVVNHKLAKKKMVKMVNLILMIIKLRNLAE